MQIQVNRFDIINQLVTLSQSPPGSSQKISEQPVVMFKRDLAEDQQRWKDSGYSVSKPAPDDEWLIFHHTLNQEGLVDSTTKYSIDKINEYVRIPLFEYKIPEYSREVLVQFGLQTAALAISLLPKDREVIKVLLALGNVLDRPDGNTGYQCWVGFAAVLKK